MSEWFKEPVLKTGDSSRAVGSNPTLSATFFPGKGKYVLTTYSHAEVPKWL